MPIHFIPQYLLDRREGGPKSWSGCCGEDKNLILLSGIEPHQMEVSGQLHMSPALALGEQPTALLLVQRQGGLQNKLLLLWGGGKSLPVPEREPQYFGWPTHSLAMILTELSWLCP
jgi:hypothetical protein